MTFQCQALPPNSGGFDSRPEEMKRKQCANLMDRKRWRGLPCV